MSTTAPGANSRAAASGGKLAAFLVLVGVLSAFGYANNYAARSNNVDTDTEMANLTSNAVQYETLAAIEQQRFAMLKSAMGS